MRLRKPCRARSVCNDEQSQAAHRSQTGDEEMRDDSEAMQNVSNRNQRVQQMQCNCIIRKFFCLGMMILLQFPIAVPGSDTMQVNLGYRTRTNDSRFNN